MLFYWSSKSELKFLILRCLNGVKHLGTCDFSGKKKFLSIVANCLKISNLLSEMRLNDAELTSILWRVNCT